MASMTCSLVIVSDPAKSAMVRDTFRIRSKVRALIVNVERKDISPVWTRSFPVSKQPKTIGEHLRKKRFDLGLRQSQPAKLLRVSSPREGRILKCNLLIGLFIIRIARSLVSR